MWRCQDGCCTQPLILELDEQGEVVRTVWRGTVITIHRSVEEPELLEKQKRGFEEAMHRYKLKEINYDDPPKFRNGS